jgi:hypothetical protein
MKGASQFDGTVTAAGHFLLLQMQATDGTDEVQKNVHCRSHEQLPLTDQLQGPRVRNFSVLQGVQIGSGAHPASYSTGTWWTPHPPRTRGSKRPVYEVDHAPPSSAEVEVHIYSPHSPLC